MTDAEKIENLHKVVEGHQATIRQLMDQVNAMIKLLKEQQ